MNKKQLQAFLTDQGYKNLRYVQGTLCGTQRMFTTTAIIIGLTEQSYERRYCFQDHNEAPLMLLCMKDVIHHPSGNWIKVKGRMNEKILDDLNPLWK